MKHGRPWAWSRVAVRGGVVLLVLAGASTAGVLALSSTGDSRGAEVTLGSPQPESTALEEIPAASQSPSPAPSGSPGAVAAGTDGGPTAAGGFGHPVYTRAEIDAWSTGSAEYTRLAGSWAGNVNRDYAPFGPEISSVERDVFRDESVYIKVQAVLWATDGNAARRNKVIALFNDLRGVTSFQWDSVEQYRLVAGWSATNLAQAAAIIGYSDSGFRRFLVSVCYPIMDWPGNPNWHASFADSKLAIAAYVGDPALWADAKAYFYQRIAQSIYHATYDGNKVRPLLNASGSPSISATRNHWGGGWGESANQINTDLTPINPAQFPNGTNAERTRDLGHVSMGLGAWMHGARTILAQGNTLEAHARDRLRAAYAHHAQRVLAYLNTGVIPAPATARGDGGEAYLMAWFGACRLFGANTPAEVQTLCRHGQVTGRPAAGANHLVAEAFADRT
ncbi:hypothetical protein Rhe02_60210 [Rhizocola hellebori]|uniref:Alginate lyase domain-containing protein n=1 Tax=Rhizocola hellebori TaxID=1392758 RepID=A0A8J3QDX3_9ACTN|nr:hypothetical protein [Rhizocola hellebori]GIH07954.1 hypothetical protein Rhe02_60210 [Rhizocola hellebori]